MDRLFKSKKSGSLLESRILFCLNYKGTWVWNLKTLQNIEKMHKTSKKGTKYRKKAQNTEKRHKIQEKGTKHRKNAQNTGKRHKIQEKGTKYRKKAQNTGKGHKTPKKGIKYRKKAQNTENLWISNLKSTLGKKSRADEHHCYCGLSLFCSREYGFITLHELIGSGLGGTVAGLLIDKDCFLAYEFREQQLGPAATPWYILISFKLLFACVCPL